MNCKYRILKKAHIGLRVRITPEKGKTVPFDNIPMTGMKIEKWCKDGFYLSHSTLPKSIWVDFHQMPLDNIIINHGIIESPITFVEEVHTGGSMILMRADTFDYLEMLQDVKDLEINNTYSISKLEIGERVISTTCKDSRKMIYLGTFYCLELFHTDSFTVPLYQYGRKRELIKKNYYLDNIYQRAIFLYEDDNTLHSFSLTNKTIKSFYKCSDRGLGGFNEEYKDVNENRQMLMSFGVLGSVKWKGMDIIKVQPNHSHLKESFDWKTSHFAFLQQEKDNIKENAKHFIEDLIKEVVHIDYSEAEVQCALQEKRGY